MSSIDPATFLYVKFGFLLFIFSVFAIMYFFSLLGSLISKTVTEHLYFPLWFGMWLLAMESCVMRNDDVSLPKDKFLLLIGLYLFSLLCAGLQVIICRWKSKKLALKKTTQEGPSCCQGGLSSIRNEGGTTMITRERADELMARFAAERAGDAASQAWRLELNEEEKALVAAWDGMLVRVLLDVLKEHQPGP